MSAPEMITLALSGEDASRIHGLISASGRDTALEHVAKNIEAIFAHESSPGDISTTVDRMRTIEALIRRSLSMLSVEDQLDACKSLAIALSLICDGDPREAKR